MSLRVEVGVVILSIEDFGLLDEGGEITVQIPTRHRVRPNEGLPWCFVGLFGIAMVISCTASMRRDYDDVVLKKAY